ncbi:MAG: EamA family transporter [Acidobacteria bacterium]|nr:EamA family transporter [Acidobacteriota bacterium]
MRIVLVLSLAVLANSVGSVCLSKGMKQFEATGATGATWLLSTSQYALTNPWVIAGIFFLVVFLVSYLAALSEADLSFVLPATAPAYVLTAWLSKVFLNEAITPTRWAGIFLIVLGTCLVGRTLHSRARQEDAAPGPIESEQAWEPEKAGSGRSVL